LVFFLGDASEKKSAPTEMAKHCRAVDLPARSRSGFASAKAGRAGHLAPPSEARVRREKSVMPIGPIAKQVGAAKKSGERNAAGLFENRIRMTTA
jgi:hypothetical protein